MLGFFLGDYINELQSAYIVSRMHNEWKSWAEILSSAFFFSVSCLLPSAVQSCIEI